MTTSPERWEAVKSLFEAAQEVPEEQVSAFLEQRAQDSEVRAEVKRLLAEARKAGGFLSSAGGSVHATSDSSLPSAVLKILSPPRFSPGTIIGGSFKIIEFIDSGGMGVVYKAEDIELHRSVALKFLPENAAADAVANARLKREAQAASALNHPNICTIYEIGNHEEHTFIAMEFLEGSTLKSMMRAQALNIEQLISIGIDIAEGLDAAHALGLLHRDIKPANIFVSKRGRAKILDFGLAKMADAGEDSVPNLSNDQPPWQQQLTVAGAVRGTAAYMSPEQASAQALDTRTDIFSFGVVLYEMATGSRPFQGTNLAEVCSSILQDVPAPATSLNSAIPARLEELICRALEKDRELRHQHAADIRAELQRLRRDMQPGGNSGDRSSPLTSRLAGAIGPDSAPELAAGLASRGQTSAGRNKWIWLAVGSVIFLAIAAIVFWRPAPTRALTEKDGVVIADFVNHAGDPVFDDALKAGITADLAQSPFLNLVSDWTVSRQLRLMGRSPETALTPEIAREVCQRENNQATLEGDISSLGSSYVITLRAVNCETGELLAMEQTEAHKKEDVLSQLHIAGRAIRKHLGESLASIQQHDTPLIQGTTSSLEALQAFSRAMKTWRSKGEAASLPLFQRAVALDPDFARANADLGVVYNILGESALSREYAIKAYQLRDRTNDVERFGIESSYFQYAIGDLEKAALVNQQWKQAYPHSLAPYENLSFINAKLGRIKQALAEDLEGQQLGPDTFRVYSNLSHDYMNLGHLQDAHAVLNEAHLRKLDSSLAPEYYELAFLESDHQQMEKLVFDATGTPDEDSLLAIHSDTEAFYGRLQSARALSRRAVDSALHADDKETAADWLASEAIREAEFGNRVKAVEKAKAALALASTTEIQVAAGMAFARAGYLDRARQLVRNLRRQFPTYTLVSKYWAPSIEAAMALERRSFSESERILQVTRPYELGGARPPFVADATLYPAYIRGEALMKLGRWEEAAREFEKIVANRGLVGSFPIGALCHLQLARAYAGTDHARAREAYNEFFAIWQGADSDIPILLDARAEYAKLN